MIETAQHALDFINGFDDPYLAAIRDHGRQTWGLDRIRALLAKLGDPHRAYPTIHVAGTKGKGSTSAFIAQGLMASGLKTGLYVSPHLQDWRERIQINRALIGEETLARLVDDVAPRVTAEDGISAFEVTTALAFWHFAREGCDAAVIEVGLGGRLDATTVVEPLVSVLTSISLDHTQLLGETLAEIAGEKAAIIKQGVRVVSAPQEPEALRVIEQRVAEMGSNLTLMGRDWQTEVVRLTWESSEARIGPVGQLEPVTISLPGAFQIDNAAVALAALREAKQAGLPVQMQAARAALAHVEWPGRLEVISREPLIVIDSAHNPYSVQRLMQALQTLDAYRSLTFVFGCMADKQVGGMLASMLPASSRVILTQAEHARAASPGDLLALAQEQVAQAAQQGETWADSIVLGAAPDTGSALKLALEGTSPSIAVCVAGSLALAGEARTILEKNVDRAPAGRPTS